MAAEDPSTQPLPSRILRLQNSAAAVPTAPINFSWGLSASGWATSEESVYPIAFCEQVAATLVHIFEQPDHGIDYHQMRASTGLQPKASKVRPVVSEHKQVVVVRGPLQFFRPPCLRMERIHDPIALHSACQCELRCLPSGAQLLHMHSSGNEGDSLCVSVWGIPYSPDEFIEAALHAGHPALATSDLPPPLARAIAKSAQSKPEALAKERTNLVRQWATRAHALEGEKRAFKRSLHPEVAKFLAPKRLLLWRELMHQFGCPDPEVFDLVTSGVSLTGEVECSGLFNSVNRPATMSTRNCGSLLPPSRLRLLPKLSRNPQKWTRWS